LRADLNLAIEIRCISWLNQARVKSVSPSGFYYSVRLYGKVNALSLFYTIIHNLGICNLANGYIKDVIRTFDGNREHH
jgi:hypothetical protein